jgi:hypothetical protein
MSTLRLPGLKVGTCLRPECSIELTPNALALPNGSNFKIQISEGFNFDIKAFEIHLNFELGHFTLTFSKLSPGLNQDNFE